MWFKGGFSFVYDCEYTTEFKAFIEILNYNACNICYEIQL